MKNIVIITTTLERYDHIRRGLLGLSQGSLKTTNSFFSIKTLISFKRHHFLQIFFDKQDLLIIDRDIIIPNKSGHLTLLQKLDSFKILNKRTKVLLLVKDELVNNSGNINTFIFDENLKIEQKIVHLFLKIEEIFKK